MQKAWVHGALNGFRLTNFLPKPLICCPIQLQSSHIELWLISENTIIFIYLLATIPGKQSIFGCPGHYGGGGSSDYRFVLQAN